MRSRFAILSGDSEIGPADKGRLLIQEIRALVVDDDSVVAEITTLHLEQMGHSVLAFTSAALALTEFKKDPFAFDVVITDYRMPELSGLGLAEEMWKVSPGTPVIFMSGYGHDLEFKVFGRAARSSILHKPFRREDLAAALREVLDG